MSQRVKEPLVLHVCQDVWQIPAERHGNSWHDKHAIVLKEQFTPKDLTQNELTVITSMGYFTGVQYVIIPDFKYRNIPNKLKICVIHYRTDFCILYLTGIFVFYL